MAPWNDQGEWEEPTGPNRIVVCRTPGCLNENIEIEFGPGDDPVWCGPCSTEITDVRKKEEGYEPPVPEPEPDPTEGTESIGDSVELNEDTQPTESVDLNEDVKEDFPL